MRIDEKIEKHLMNEFKGTIGKGKKSGNLNYSHGGVYFDTSRFQEALEDLSLYGSNDFTVALKAYRVIEREHSQLVKQFKKYEKGMKTTDFRSKR